MKTKSNIYSITAKEILTYKVLFKKPVTAEEAKEQYEEGSDNIEDIKNTDMDGSEIINIFSLQKGPNE